METLDHPLELRRCIDEKAGGESLVGFVPTMGNLHEGHLDLVRRCTSRCGVTVVSIFVNPLQFGEGEDFADYPRTMQSDLDALDAIGTDIVFTPTAEVLYPRGLDDCTFVHVPALGDMLCGHYRPGFFRGVCTVVSILLNMVAPHVAFFGEKDYQQLLVIRRMVEDLAMPVRIEAVATRRDPDGLAMSSRNNYLSREQRACAPRLYETLERVRSRLEYGAREYAALESDALESLQSAGFRVDYLRVLDADELGEPRTGSRQLRVVAAAWLGGTRLIDNVAVQPPR